METQLLKRLHKLSKVHEVTIISVMSVEEIEKYIVYMRIYERIIREKENSVLNKQYSSVENKIEYLINYIN